MPAKQASKPSKTIKNTNNRLYLQIITKQHPNNTKQRDAFCQQSDLCSTHVFQAYWVEVSMNTGAFMLCQWQRCASMLRSTISIPPFWTNWSSGPFLSPHVFLLLGWPCLEWSTHIRYVIYIYICICVCVCLCAYDCC